MKNEGRWNQVANGHGGRRPGAGRPKGSTGSKSLRTIIREKAIEEAGDDAKYALGLFVDSARDEKLELAMRLMCGKEVMDRVWGKPTQRQEHSGLDGAPLAIHFVRRKDD